MEVKMLDAKIHVDVESGCLVRYVKSETEYFRPHNHNYYELFLTLRGEMQHTVNGKTSRLTSGNLLFIRDFDVHNFAVCDSSGFDFINMSFEKETLDTLFSYLGGGFNGQKLLSCPQPPCIKLSEREKNSLFYSLTELNLYKSKEEIKTRMRALLLNIFTKYFYNYSVNISEIPLWLEIAFEKIKKPENFVEGMDRFVRISGKSREHLARSLKKYYGISPSELLCELRLNYAVNLMRTSNLTVTDICFECGFSNLSWFYEMFEKKLGTTPLKYSRQYKVL